MFSDLRSASRQFTKKPAFTTIAVLTLALGIGVNTSMFSVLNTYLLQRAPYPQADRLVRVYRTSPQAKASLHSAPDLADVRAADSDSLASLTAFHWWRFSLSEPGQPADQLQGIVVSADFFRTIGIWPALGRAFTPEEQQPGRSQVVILTDALWRSRFGADPDIVGRTIRIDGAPQTVIGVMPPEFAYPLFWGKLDAIRPLVLATAWQNARSETWLDAIARLKPGVSVAQAQAEIAAIASRLAQQHPDTNAGTSIHLVPMHETAVDSTGLTISWLTMGLAVFVLLIACTNRMALGAQPGDVLRLVLGRGIQLALIGVVIGLAGAAGLLRALATILPGLSGYDPLTLVVVVTLLLAAALIASWLPARRAMRVDPNVALRAE